MIFDPRPHSAAKVKRIAAVVDAEAKAGSTDPLHPEVARVAQASIWCLFSDATDCVTARVCERRGISLLLTHTRGLRERCLYPSPPTHPLFRLSLLLSLAHTHTRSNTLLQQGLFCGFCQTNKIVLKNRVLSLPGILCSRITMHASCECYPIRERPGLPPALNTHPPPPPDLREPQTIR